MVCSRLLASPGGCRVSFGGLWVPLLLLVLGSVSPAHAACPATFQDVVADTEAALVAYESADLLAFDAARETLDQDLGCLDGILEPAEVLPLHLVAVLAAWRRQDEEGTRSAIRAVLALEEDFVLQAQVGILDPRLVALFDEVAESDPMVQNRVLPLIPWSVWRIDGAQAEGLIPVGRSVVVQLSDTRSDTTRTWYLPWGGVPADFEDPDMTGQVAWQLRGPLGVEEESPTLSSLSGDRSTASAPVDLKVPEEGGGLFSSSGRSRRLALAGGGIASVGVLSLVYAARLKDDFLTCSADVFCDESQLIGTVVDNQIAGYGGYALLLTGAGLSIGAVVSRRF